MKYWQSLKSLQAMLILIFLILSCQEEKGEEVRGYVETDAEFQSNNVCGVDKLQILVTTESGKSAWFTVPEGYWMGKELLSLRPTNRRIYVKGRYSKGFLENCSEYRISFLYLKE